MDAYGAREKQEEYLDVKELPADVVDDTVEPPVTGDLIAKDWLGARAIVLHDVLTAAECQRAIAFFDSYNPTEKCMSRTDYRNNFRVVAIGDAVAKTIFSRIRPHLPQTEVITRDVGSFYVNQGMGMYGTWEIESLNPCFRICKYDPDGHFAPHYDSDYVATPEHRSLKTFMIYLNDDYGAGETNFVDDHALFFDDAAKRYKAPASAVKAGLKARQGDALIFDHNILHEGATVSSGVKYIMRCEVMYRRVPLDESHLSPEEQKQLAKERLAMTYLRQAQLLEADRHELEAVEFYRKAFKLLPSLERSL
jgi:prolyl 4-hydroxylase